MEIFINFLVWISACLYSLYNVYEFSATVSNIHNFTEDLIEGWSVLGKYKDSSDYEWNAWKQFALTLLPWVSAHILIAEYFRNKKHAVKLWYCIISFSFTLYAFGILALIMLVLQPLAYFITLKMFGTTKSIWICSCTFLIVTNVLKSIYENMTYTNPISFVNMTDEDMYMVLITILWTQLRCISYSLDIVSSKKSSNCEDKRRLKSQQDTIPDFLDLLSYAFYLPLLFLGPIVLYEDFSRSVNLVHPKPFSTRLKYFLCNISTYLWWMMFLEFCLHFIYFNSLQYHIEVFQIMPDWSLYGGGLWMGLYFYIKYLIIYGIAGTFTALDTIAPETPPRCIARVHRYSQMWKYFDVGLHKFLIKYIFKPIVDEASKKSIARQIFTRCIGSLMCFIFVFFWHGAHHFILVWTILNFFGIVIENLGKTLSQNKTFNDKKISYGISSIMLDRFNALLAALILVISALSNFYFFAGSEVGKIYVDRVKNQSIYSFSLMIFILYNSCRTSQYLNNVHARSIKI